MSEHAELPAEQVMFRMVTGYWVSQIVGAVAELRLADFLVEGPRTHADLAQKSSIHPDSCLRLLRAGCSIGIFKTEGNRFFLTPIGETLRSDVPNSMRGMAMAQSSPGHWLPWGRLREALRTHAPQAKAALGAEIFEYYRQHDEEGKAFTNAMRNLSAQVIAEVARIAEVPETGTVVDVGGARGNLVAAVLQAHPRAKGIVIDLPQVGESANQAFKAAKLEGRCEFIGGDFFKEVPKGDLYILKQVLHDWNDEQCVTILKNCARGMSANGRVLVVEMVVPTDGRPSLAPLMDLNMMVMLPGKERTREEYQSLFSLAGLRLHDVTDTRSPFQIVEARRTA